MDNNTPRRMLTKLLPLLLIVAGSLMCGTIGWYAYTTNGGFGFPLDDPWIHLQFAKNLHDYGSFSYFKNEMVTSGSTSPLYTCILAAGFFVTSNEMVLSYVFGIGFLMLAGYYMFRLAALKFQGRMLIASTAAMLLLFEPRLQWVALSGMETTLFVALLLAASYFYEQKKGIPLGIALGLLLWSRPEAVIFVATLVVDLMYHTKLVKHTVSKKGQSVVKAIGWEWVKRPMLIVAGFAALYLVFNYVLSGTPLPNTYAAKIKYYSGGSTGFPLQVFHFLVDGHMVVLAPFVIIGILVLLFGLVKRRPQSFLIALLWPLLMFIAYWKNLPYLYQQGRYLIPILPFIILLGLDGLRIAVDFGKRIIPNLGKREMGLALVLLILFGQFVLATWDSRKPYSESCKYITDRQVRTAHWLHDNLPDNAIVATHDIGAIAFYSQRRISDMVGLVSPEMINGIGSLNKLQQFLVAKKATHLAVLRNWFEVVNQEPIFKTRENHPEIMEVFLFDPARTHFTPRAASGRTEIAASYLSSGRVQEAITLLQQSLQVDPQSSKTHAQLANALMQSGRLEEAEASLRIAVQLHPTSPTTQLFSAQLAGLRNQPTKAISQLESLIQTNPDYAPGYFELARLYEAFHLDSLKVNEYRHRYDALLRAQSLDQRQD